MQEAISLRNTCKPQRPTTYDQAARLCRAPTASGYIVCRQQGAAARVAGWQQAISAAGGVGLELPFIQGG